MDKKLEKLQKQYEDVVIPEKLDAVIEEGLKKKPRKSKKIRYMIGTAAAAAMLFTASINMNETLARELNDLPVVGKFVQVLSFVEYEMEDVHIAAKIEVPQVTGSSDEINALNAKFTAEAKELYNQFVEEIGTMEGGYLTLESGYIVETDTEQLLSFARYIFEAAASSNTELQYVTIDKQQEMVIQFPSLFKDDRYVDVISSYIIEQMQAEMNETKGEKQYWVGGTEWSYDMENFEQIKKDQNFFITPEGKLVIVFNKYEVAPGYMGNVSFEIPTEIIQSLLVSNVYIR